MVDPLPAQPRKGRGAVGNPTGRYEPHSQERIDDGWAGTDDEEEPALETTVLPDASRTVIARNQSPDVPFEQSINPYRGCEHGCIYCFARPSHAYLGLSPGLDFESRLFAKTDAAHLLRAELARPGYRPSVIALGANTDPYQPVERKLEITRHVLRVLAECRHPCAIVTKSALVLRDLDILAPMARQGLVRVLVSITTLDRALARVMEPRAATPPRRLATIAELARHGVPTGVLASPMIPALNDAELEAILEAAATAGAQSAGYILLRLPLEIKELFTDWLRAHCPDRADHVLSLLRQTRGGRLYDAAYGRRMTGTGAYASLLSRRFAIACKRLGLATSREGLDTTRFRPPAGDARQLSLF